jgi:hypothetical protein
VSSARIFADFLPLNSDSDENTLLTDHWLSFVAARHGGQQRCTLAEPAARAPAAMVGLPQLQETCSCSAQVKNA